MNTPHLPRSERSKGLSGFTLIELLIVISIILILAGLTLGAFRFANVKAARDKTRAQMKAIELVLDRYSLDYGSYPSPDLFGSQEGTEHGPGQLDTQGAEMLYVLMSGDTNLDGVSDADDDELFQGSSGAIGAAEEDKFGMVEYASNGNPLIVDGFGNPIMYSVWIDKNPDPDIEDIKPSLSNSYPQRNGTYDLFSIADDEGVDNSSYTSSLEAKWITNW